MRTRCHSVIRYATGWTLVVLATVATSGAQSPPLHIDGTRFVDAAGDAFRVKGIHYGPWRPGTGPAKGYPYPENALIEEDFALIRATAANTVLIFDPPARVLDLAEEFDLQVLYCFALDWWAIGGDDHEALAEQVVATVRRLRDKSALMGWILGNEIPPEVLHARGSDTVVGGLYDLYQRIAQADTRHPVSHANSVLGKHLDLGFLDFVSFNVYPTWPPEVVAQGFGSYITDVLTPLARGRPLLLTEFGVNSIEAGAEGQARLLLESWAALVDTDAAGGIVFEFADEWWKNYNNPVQPGNWWFREAAPNDELTNDRDPEESYGLVTSDRQPKPAYDAVAAMFAEPSSGRAQRVAVTIIVILVLAATALWLRATWTRPRRACHHRAQWPRNAPRPRIEDPARAPSYGLAGGRANGATGGGLG